ncbi:anthrone oxygenase family protein [Streptomyces sp. NPDC020490]|uniref:anthrone oxygenase family protein n=1 Tax=Streptomyces sp. NPDC020490 TaxID=3365078 RepID=UPI0037AB6CFD
MDDASFTLVMRTVNRKVPGPLFLLLFLGSLAFPAVSFFVAPEARDESEGTLVGVAALCALAGHLITSSGNVPLNNALESSRGRGDERAARMAFEGRWNALHGVRTLLAVAAFVLVAAALAR